MPAGVFDAGVGLMLLKLILVYIRPNKIDAILSARRETFDDLSRTRADKH